MDLPDTKGGRAELGWEAEKKKSSTNQGQSGLFFNVTYPNPRQDAIDIGQTSSIPFPPTISPEEGVLGRRPLLFKGIEIEPTTRVVHRQGRKPAGGTMPSRWFVRKERTTNK